MAAVTLDQAQVMADRAIRATRRVRRDLAALFSRAAGADGYASSTRPRAGSSSGLVDPTAGRALAPHPGRDELARVLRLLEDVAAKALAADAARARVLGGAYDGECHVCALYGVSSPEYRDGVCAADYSWRRRHGGEDPPEDVVTGGRRGSA